MISASSLTLRTVVEGGSAGTEGSSLSNAPKAEQRDPSDLSRHFSLSADKLQKIKSGFLGCYDKKADQSFYLNDGQGTATKKVVSCLGEAGNSEVRIVGEDTRITVGGRLADLVNTASKKGHPPQQEQEGPTFRLIFDNSQAATKLLDQLIKNKNGGVCVDQSVQATRQGNMLTLENIK